MATPDFGAVADTANVWTSGAAVAAFDAFGLPNPVPIADPAAPQVIAITADHTPGFPDLPQPGPAPEPGSVDPIVDHPPLETIAQDWSDDAGWQQPNDPQAPDHHPVDHPGFAPALGMGADLGLHEPAHTFAKLLVFGFEDHPLHGVCSCASAG
jgi:hypothetical protein